MTDKGHEYADKVLEQIIKNLIKGISGDEAEKKILDYLKRHEAEINAMLEKVDGGEITLKEFRQWADRNILRGKEWEKVRDEVADIYVEQMEKEIVATGFLVTMVYLANRNYMSRVIETAMKTQRGKIYHLPRIKNLLKPIIPKASDPRKNTIWHRHKLQATIRNGMRKGESVPKIAKRVQRVTDMDRKAAIRTARTAVTSAENKGRLDSFYDAESMGIPMEKQWYATKDSRTRTSHRVIDGERVPLNEEFSNGLMYPADPSGDPAEVYNCRCTLLGVPDGIDLENIPESPTGMGKMEWVGAKPTSKPL